jgi:hypothetical protein
MTEHDQSWAEFGWGARRTRWGDRERRHALAILAKAGQRGEAHAVLMANGVERSLIRDLVRSGHAKVATAGPYRFNTRASRIRITAAGQRLLAINPPEIAVFTAGVRGIVERNWPHLVAKLPPRDE